MAKTKQLFDDFLDREEQSLELMLVASAQKASITIREYIDLRRLQGATDEAIYNGLLDDLNNRGRLFGEFRNSIKATVSGSVNRLRDDALYAENGIVTKYRWVAVLINTCPDCLDRHGKVKSWEEWEADGLPRTGETVCKQHCNCMLVPAEVTELDELEPIRRGK